MKQKKVLKLSDKKHKSTENNTEPTKRKVGSSNKKSSVELKT